jgi:enoyl-CoA hydratase/carnithine racemase
MTRHSAPVSVALARQLVWRNLGAPHPMLKRRLDSRALQERGRSADAQEDISAFLEKREARFANNVSCDAPDLFNCDGDPQFE